jgi:hypothetical protein
MPTRSLGFLLTSPSGGFNSPVMILMMVLKPDKKTEVEGGRVRGRVGGKEGGGYENSGGEREGRRH